MQRQLQPTDLDEKLTALRRRTAGLIRIKAARPQPPIVPPQSSRISPRSSPRRIPAETDHDDFSRRLKISSSPTPPTKSSKLFNPDSDPIPVRKQPEPEQTSYLPRSTPAPSPRDSHSRQLFDHRKDDPVRFSVLARPHRDRPPSTSKSSGDYISASSTSSYANSVSSSSFTLSSTTDGSSASSALFDRHGASRSRGDEGGNNVFSIQLKNLYRAITNLETKIKMEDVDDPDDPSSAVAALGAAAARITLKGKDLESPKSTEEEIEREKWKNQIADHKQLAEVIHNLLEISLSPSVPASLRNIPTKYNIIVRLWTYAFHKLLESLRRASFTSQLALEHLQDFIYYAYTFYTGLLEEPTLSGFKSGWLEALGDLARYRMAVAAMVSGSVDPTTSGGRKTLTVKAVNEAVTDQTRDSDKVGEKSISDKPAARIDDSPSPSVGIAAARLMDVEPETERWRGIARDWYGAGLAEQPGTGKLHHHLGLLCREVEGEELRGVYHFVKSMTTLHPFPTSRESVLAIWSPAAQARRTQPDVARVPDLFLLLHGMLFTHIQLDDFQPTLARFIERLEIEGAEEREWIMMGVVNIGAVFEYGRPGTVLRRVGGKEMGSGVGTEVAAMKVMMAKKVLSGGNVTSPVDEETMEVDEPRRLPVVRTFGSHQISPTTSECEEVVQHEDDHPPSFKYALQLTFAMLSHVLRRPTRKASPFARSTLNPYLTVLLTFLSTVLRHLPTLALMERSIPWEELATFFAIVPRGIMSAQGLSGKDAKKEAADRWAMLTSGCAPPLPEDWCLRGMEWVGRKVFERGYWKSGEDRRAESEVLEETEGGDVTDGQIEDDDDADDSGSGDVVKKRWVRIVRSAIGISAVVDGFIWVEGTREWKVEGRLAEKVRKWRELDRIEQEEEEKRRLGTRWTDDPMDIDEGSDDTLSEEEDDESDTDEVKALKARRRYLRSLLDSAQRGSPMSASPRRPSPRTPRKTADKHASLPISPGYTVLVIDTNILLSSLSMFASVVESLRWTVMVPLPVVMELDGLSKTSANSAPQLIEAAQSALAYLSSHVRSHSMSLKIQTSKGNYLTSLSVRTEHVDFDAHGNWERNMDDLILKAAIWQDEHWVDRSSMLRQGHFLTSSDRAGVIKVVLLSLDRNLRLKARSRQLPAASEKDLASILANPK